MRHEKTTCWGCAGLNLAAERLVWELLPARAASEEFLESKTRIRSSATGTLLSAGRRFPINAFERSREDPAGERGHQDYASPDHAAKQFRTDPPTFMHGRFLRAAFSVALGL